MSKPKIIVIGEKAKQQKPIKFIKSLWSDGKLEDIVSDEPTDFEYIELICRNYGSIGDESFDLIFCYNSPDNRCDGVLFLGRWNDGIIK